MMKTNLNSVINIIIVCAVVLCLGYIFQDDTFVFNVYDIYYVMTGFGISLLMIYAIVLFWILRYAFRKLKRN
jgi:hypothetical protein